MGTLIVAVTALLVAVAAWVQGRRTVRKLEQVTEMYWQLKFDHGQLKARVQPPEPPASQTRTTFVPLDRLTGLRPESIKPAPESGGAGSGSEP